MPRLITHCLGRYENGIRLLKGVNSLIVSAERAQHFFLMVALAHGFRIHSRSKIRSLVF